MGRSLRRATDFVRRIGADLAADKAALYLLVAVLIASVLGLGLWWIPKWQVASLRDLLPPRELFELENEARVTLAQVLAGGALLMGLYFYWKRVAAMEKDVEVAKKGQVTERFTHAIEQLGNEKLEVRLGGIYALERLARNYDQYRATILEVLAACVRERCPWQGDQASAEEPLPRDIQAALTILGQDWSRGEGEGASALDFSSMDLREADLTAAHLEQADLSAAHLEAADLRDAHLNGADLNEAHLEGATLIGADLQEAILTKAHLEGANLGEANLQRANLSGAHLQEAELWGARLDKADLTGAHLEGARLWTAQLTGAELWGASLDNCSLSEAQLEGARLWKAKLTGANLSSANLQGAYLWGADLQGANLKDAHLQDANLNEAQLQGADLRGAEGLTQEQLDRATTDDNTLLSDAPEGPVLGQEQTQ